MIIKFEIEFCFCNFMVMVYGFGRKENNEVKCYFKGFNWFCFLVIIW